MNSPIPTTAKLIEQSCLIEVMSHKPGNVHPGSEFADATVRDFVHSARVIAPILGDAEQHGVGASIETAVLATQNAVGHNTNLGIVLLMAPLAAVTRSISLESGISSVLNGLSVDDAVRTYAAIRAAAPGGLGESESQDVHTAPTESLVDCMRHAADRDLIAQQYVNGFHDVLTTGLDWLKQSQAEVRETDRIAWTALQWLRRFGDTLIARKCGPAMSETVQRRAADVLSSGWPRTKTGRQAYSALDEFLRADGNRRNPGTTADMIAAIVFAGLRSGDYAVNECLLSRQSIQESS